MFRPIWTYWASFPLNFSHWNWLCIQNIKLPNFSGTFPEFSGNLEISGNCLVLANFIILGIFPTQFMSLSLILKSEFQNSNFSRHFPDIFWKSGNSPEFAIFGQFQHIGHHVHLILIIEIDFALRISNFQIFLELFQKISRFPEHFWNNSRKIWILKFWLQNQAQWPKLSGKNTQCIEIGQN